METMQRKAMSDEDLLDALKAKVGEATGEKLLEVLTKKAPATAAERAREDAKMAAAISTVDAAQPAAGTGPNSPARPAKSSGSKRAQTLKGAGKKTGKKE